MAVRRCAAPLAISMGDPAGIGAEVILKAAAALARRRESPPLVVVGDLGAMRACARRLGGVPEPCAWRSGDRLAPLGRRLSVLAASELPASSYAPGRPTVRGSDASYRYVVTGARMAMAGEAVGLVTAPINKEWLNRAGHGFPGHSELLAKLAGARRWRMMFVGRELKLALVTVHMGLAKVPRALTREGVYQTIRLLADHLRAHEGIMRPRIGVLGFNPHAGENGMFGDEEGRVIAPAIRRAVRDGIDARGPLAPDTAFTRPAGSFGFDAAVAMYHDQGLIALKTLDFDHAVNVTLGLPFTRTSPDHGTAFDIAGRGRASASSMVAAIEYAWRSAQRSSRKARRVA